MRWLARLMLRRVVNWAWGNQSFKMSIEVLVFEDDPENVGLRVNVFPMSYDVQYSPADALELAEAFSSAAYAAIAQGD